MNAAKATMPLRHRLAYTLAAIPAPRLALELKQMHHWWTKGTPRPFTLFLKQHFKHRVNPLVGCEIGFGIGDNAVSLEKELNIGKLYCVDPIFGREPYIDAHGTVVNWYLNREEDIEKNWNKLQKTEFFVMTSDEAFKKLPFNLDFFYIDGNHAYAYAYRDIKNALAHVKNGGFVGGHDFGSTSFEVTEAVFQIAKEIGQTPKVDVPDFWFRKEA